MDLGLVLLFTHVALEKGPAIIACRQTLANYDYASLGCACHLALGIAARMINVKGLLRELNPGPLAP